jgi:hypothetical protein
MVLQAKKKVRRNPARRKIHPDFNGGNRSSNCGILLLRQTDERICLTERVSEIFSEYDNSQYRIFHGSECAGL